MATVVASVGLVGSIVLILLFCVVPHARDCAADPPRSRDGAPARGWGISASECRRPALGKFGMLEGTFNTMAASLEDSQAKLQRFAEEQAALRRVATLVARDVPPEKLLESVAREVTGVLGSDSTGLLRYEPDGEVTLLATWTGPKVDRAGHGELHAPRRQPDR